MKPLFCRLVSQLGELGTLTFAEIWESALKEEKALKLGEDERAVLLEMGMSLGRYGAQEQDAAISRCIKRLENCLYTAELKERNGERLYKGLGLAFGVAVVIVLL